MKIIIKNSIKRLYFIIVIILTFSLFACQPTPEDLIVKNKDGRALRKAIDATAILENDYKKINQIIDNKINKKGDICINFNANVIMPNVDKLPIVYVEKDFFTQEQINKMIQVFFKGAKLYDYNVKTKADIENDILRLKKSALDLNSDLAQSNNIDNLVDLKQLANELITSYNKKWKEAPENKPEIEKFDITSDDTVRASTNLGKEDIAYIKYFNHEIYQRIVFYNFGGPYAMSRRFLDSRSSRLLDINNYCNEEFLVAKKNALNMIENMGIKGFDLNNICISQDQTHILVDDSYGVNSEREFYVFCFDREINGIAIDNSFYTGNRLESKLDSNNPLYEKPFPYETLQIWMEGKEVVQFLWENPIKVASMANDNVEVRIDAKSACDTMSQHFFVRYADMLQGYADKLIINIDEIKLVLARIKEKDTGKYIVVPVWDFYGNIQVEASEENAKIILPSNCRKDGNMYIITDSLKSMLSINALDNSILDREIGH